MGKLRLDQSISILRSLENQSTTLYPSEDRPKLMNITESSPRETFNLQERPRFKMRRSD